MNFNQLNQIKKEVKQEITKIKKNNETENETEKENEKEDEKINIQFKWSGFKPQIFQYYTINK